MRVASPGRRLAALYFAIQALAGAAWWLILGMSPASRAWFQPEGYPAGFILTYAAADAVLFVGASAVTASLLLLNKPGWRASIWLTTGAVLYASLHCFGVAVSAAGYWPSAAMMAAAAFCSALIAFTMRADEPELPRVTFRGLSRATGPQALARTLAQMAVFWTLFLILIPLLLTRLERSIGIASLAARPVIGATMFAAGGSLGIWSAAVMALRGHGTPLPNQCATRLVVSGPYARVRNPMAVAGIAQMLGVAIMWGSWFVVGFGVVGGLIWEWCLRPAEEADLETRFGDDFRRYRASVRCWWPRLTRFKVEAAASGGESSQPHAAVNRK